MNRLANFQDNTVYKWREVRFDLTNTEDKRLGIMWTVEDFWNFGFVGFDDVLVTEGPCAEGRPTITFQCDVIHLQ